MLLVYPSPLTFLFLSLQFHENCTLVDLQGRFATTFADNVRRRHSPAPLINETMQTILNLNYFKNTDLWNISVWLRLTLNINKSKCMIIGSSQKLYSSFSTINLKLENSALDGSTKFDLVSRLTAC